LGCQFTNKITIAPSRAVLANVKAATRTFIAIKPYHLPTRGRSGLPLSMPERLVKQFYVSMLGTDPWKPGSGQP
jgi:hypothetical protein